MAITLAKHWGTEIVSFDSRQFFREMSIGTAKPSPQQMAEVPHHFIGHISIHDPYSAGRYAVGAEALLNRLFSKHQRLVMVGGSGLYLDALIKGFDELPAGTEEHRTMLSKLLQEEGITALQSMLRGLDPEYYGQVDLQNPHRLIRALEVTLAAGMPYSALRKGKQKKPDFSCYLAGLDLPREELYARINARAQQMIDNGLVEEVRSLLPFRHLNALQTVGYKEIFGFLDGTVSLEEATAAIRQNTRRFAKRQLTWFRRYEEIRWHRPSAADEVITAAENFFLT